MAIDNTYPQTGNQERQDGNLHVPSGHLIDIETGGKITINDVDATPTIVAAMTKGTGTPTGTVAAAGSVQGDAAAMPNADFTVVTGADGTKGVILPVFAAGTARELKNNSGSILKVYPSTGAAINGISANGSISMAANTIATFKGYSPTQIFTLPLLPS